MVPYDQQGQKASSPAAERNKEPILEVLKQHLGPSASGTLLEVASGSGQHTAHFAPAFPALTFQPSDLTPELFGSIHEWCHDLPNVRLPPLILDASSDPATWPLQPLAAPGSSAPQLTAMLVINMCHISPWTATQGMLRGAGSYLAPGGRLCIYGPFKKNNEHTSEGNVAFDASLRSRNPLWGYRDVAEVTAAASELAGLTSEAVHEMPANNFMLVYRKP